MVHVPVLVDKQPTASVGLGRKEVCKVLFFIDQSMFLHSALSNFCFKQDFTYFVTFISQLPLKTRMKPIWGCSLGK